jgi:PhnB protein
MRSYPVPEDSKGAVPYLIVRGAAEALAFYAAGFGAVESMRLPDEKSGRIGHADLAIGAARFMLADEYPELGIVGPQTVGGTTVTIHVYVENVDAFTERAVAAGASVVRPITDMFYGDRAVILQDPFGHRWSFASRIEEVSVEEMKRRAAQAPAE